MHIIFSSILLFFFGLFLMGCGVAAVLLIGLKAKTALLSGSLSGILAMLTGHWIAATESMEAKWTGILLTLVLFGVFAWRAAKTFDTLLDLTASSSPERKGKATAFLLIALMAVVSLFATLMQCVWF
jgi:hypothetical protein